MLELKTMPIYLHLCGGFRSCSQKKEIPEQPEVNTGQFKFF